MEATRELARFIVRTGIDSVPREVVEAAKDGVLDHLAVTIAGSREPVMQMLNRYYGTPATGQQSWSAGRPTGLPAPEAAYWNGTASHVLDYDDCSDEMLGHPTAPVLPVSLALGEATGASGEAVLLSYIVGFEVESKLGRVINPWHYEHAWHPTATLGTFGAAAAAAKLLGLSEEQTMMALALAASTAAGVKQNFGSMIKSLHIGHSARCGIQAGLLAQAGLEGNPQAVEGPQGFFMAFNGADHFATEPLTELGRLWSLATPGILYKLYPCCGSTHAPADCMLHLVTEHGFAAGDVERILLEEHPRRMPHTNRPGARSGLEGKFSVQYVLASAVLNQKVGLAQFTDANVSDAPAQALMQRVELRAHPDLPPASTENQFGARVTVTLQGGRSLAYAVTGPRGWRGPDDRISRADLQTKFCDCTAGFLPPARMSAATAAIAELERLPRIGDLTALLQTE